jgi:hypothetical protein
LKSFLIIFSNLKRSVVLSKSKLLTTNTLEFVFMYIYLYI